MASPEKFCFRPDVMLVIAYRAWFTDDIIGREVNDRAFVHGYHNPKELSRRIEVANLLRA